MRGNSMSLAISLGLWWELRGKGQRTCIPYPSAGACPVKGRFCGKGQGQACLKGELALAVGQIRRRLSVACMRANLSCLLNRMSLQGEAARQAQGRRQALGWEEEKMRREKQAQWLGCIRFHGIAHRGAFHLI